ncbi:LysR family transcriptional regulator [Nocardioides sp. BGMRC 2183]|nr:LysR family transcriptional regulator [Nocardioides sp. BGMRC 2183]
MTCLPERTSATARSRNSGGYGRGTLGAFQSGPRLITPSGNQSVGQVRVSIRPSAVPRSGQVRSTFFVQQTPVLDTLLDGSPVNLQRCGRWVGCIAPPSPLLRRVCGLLGVSVAGGRRPFAVGAVIGRGVTGEGKRVRIEQLQYIQAISRYGSLRKASDHLKITQPSLTDSVKRLEAELGVQLLERDRTGTRMSRRGLELLSLMAEVVDSADRLRQAAGTPVDPHRVVAVGSVVAARSTVLMPAVRTFRERHPDVPVEIRSMQRDDIFHELRSGALDVGLVNVLEGDESPSGLASTPLIHAEPVAVLPGGTDLPARPISPTDLADLPYIALKVGYVMQRFGAWWMGARATPSLYTADGPDIAKALVSEGFGYTFLPVFTVAGDPMALAGTITYRRLSGAVRTVTLMQMEQADAHQPPNVKAFRAELVKHAAAARRFESD